MKIIIPPLHGKYYSTPVQFVLDDGRTVNADFSSLNDHVPSDREDFLRENPEEICDGHYERSATWEVLLKLQEVFGE